MQLIEDKYGGPFIKGGTTLSYTKPELTAALKAKTWHHLSISITRSGYVVKMNGQIIANVPSSDLNNWGRSQNVSLTLGNFDGWIDELVVRSVNQVNANSATLTPLGASSNGFRMRIAGQSGSSYVVQASQDSKTWSNVGSVTLSGSTAEFTDTAKTPGFRLYRAYKQ